MDVDDMNWRFALIGLSLLVLITGVSAIPPLPYEFYGNATINGSPAPAGTLIIAKIADAEVGNITTDAPGIYGGPATFDKRLVVNGADNQIGQYITFWVAGQQASQKVKLWAGESQKLNLDVEAGKGGSIDASITPSQDTTVAEIPSATPTKKSPLGIAPVIAILGVIVLIARRQ